MTDLKTAAQQALEALEDAKSLLNGKDSTTTMWFAKEITDLRTALADQNRGWYTVDEINAKFAPPQRKPLSEEEIDHAANNILTDDPVQWWRKLARAIEAAHGIGGEG